MITCTLCPWRGPFTSSSLWTMTKRHGLYLHWLLFKTCVQEIMRANLSHALLETPLAGMASDRQLNEGTIDLTRDEVGQSSSAHYSTCSQGQKIKKWNSQPFSQHLIQRSGIFPLKIMQTEWKNNLHCKKHVRDWKLFLIKHLSSTSRAA